MDQHKYTNVRRPVIRQKPKRKIAPPRDYPIAGGWSIGFGGYSPQVWTGGGVETWLESELFAYPDGKLKRRGLALCEDGELREIRAGVPDSAFTVPARARIDGKYVNGFLTAGDDILRFRANRPPQWDSYPVEVIYLEDGYAGSKERTGWYRDVMVWEAKQTVLSQLYFQDGRRRVRECRLNGRPKTWRRFPGVVLSLKYGLKECFHVGDRALAESSAVSPPACIRLVYPVGPSYPPETEPSVIRRYLIDSGVIR